MQTSEAIQKGKQYIPGLTQLLSKQPTQFAPGSWPTYYSKASGTYLWDLNDQKYLDMSISGIGANVLGYNDPDVNKAVVTAIEKGNSTSLNCFEEVELAEILCDLHPWAKKVRYSRTGGEAMAIAVRIARAATKRDKILFCGYHGWHDWYLAANLKSAEELDEHLLPGLNPRGVPQGLKGTSIPFRYNDIENLRELIKKHQGEIAAITMEPIRNEIPVEGFLEEVRKLADEHSLILIFDEISSGFRIAAGGAHLKLGVMPDMAIFAKAMSNGYPMSAIIGREDIMSAAEETFISSTYWTDRIGPTAAIATIKKFIKHNVQDHLMDLGKEVQSLWKKASHDFDLPLDISGKYPMSYMKFLHPELSQHLMTKYIELMVENNVLACSRYYANYAQSFDHINELKKNVHLAFEKITQHLKEGTLETSLKGPVCKPGFHRLN